MYVILVNKDNTLVATQTQNIMQRSKLVDELWFLVQPTYNDLQIIDCTALLEYVLPISHKYSPETLVASPEGYKGYLKFTLPVDTNLTAEFGEIELTLTFIFVGLDKNNNIVQRVRKTFPTTIKVHPTKSWSDVIPDSALSVIDQRIIKTDAQIKELQEMSILFDLTKADNIKFDEDTAELQLMSGEFEIGDKVSLKSIKVDDDTLIDGVPVVDFNANGSDDDSSGDINPDDGNDDPVEDDNTNEKPPVDEDGEVDNVVEFGKETDNVVEF